MSDWVALPLSELAEVRVSNVDKKVRLGETPVQLCNYMDVYTNDYIDSNLEFMQSTANSIEKEKFKVCSGDVIITKDSETPFDIGIPAVVMEDIHDLVCGYHLALIKPNINKVEPVYLSKQLASDAAARYFSRMAAGSTRYGLSNGAIAATAIPITPIEHQRKIAAILITIDQAIEKTEALIHKYQQIKAGLMHDLFTRGLTADGKLRPPREQAPELYQETPIGWIPMAWEFSVMGNVIKEYLYGPRFDANLYNKNGNVKTIRGTDFSKEGEILYSQAPAAQLPAAKLKQHILIEGDVVIVTTADCGLTAVFESQDVNFIPSAYAVKYKFSHSVSPYFIKYYMQTSYAKNQVKKYVRQGTLGNLPGSDLLRFWIQIPNRKEQIEIVKRIDTIAFKITEEKRTLDKLKKQKSGLMYDLLTGKVQVTIDPKETAHGA